MKVTISLPPFDRHPDSKIKSLVRLALTGKKDEIKLLTPPLVVEACARGRIVADARKGRLTPAPPMQGDAAKMYFAPILAGIREGLGAIAYEAKCTEAKGTMGLVLIVYEAPRPEEPEAS